MYSDIYEELVYCPKCGSKLTEVLIFTTLLHEKVCNECGFLATERKDFNMNEFFKQTKIIPSPCKNCHNHPSNGGSEICHCTLGTPKIT